MSGARVTETRDVGKVCGARWSGTPSALCLAVFAVLQAGGVAALKSGRGKNAQASSRGRLGAHFTTAKAGISAQVA